MPSMPVDICGPRSCSWRSIFSYTSIKFVTVKSPKLAVLNWALRLGVLLYVIIYTVFIQRGYQSFGGLVGTVSPKVKGVGLNDVRNTVHDIYDGVIPAMERDSLFVTTKFLKTRQQMGICRGDSGSTEGCTTDADCASRKGNITSNGINTGECDEESGFCFIEAWCPLEVDEEQNWAHVENIDAWTVFVKSNVRFPDFDVSRTNAFDIQANGAPTYGQNLFTVRDLIEGSDYEQSTAPIQGTGSYFEDVNEWGAIIQVTLSWDCNFDHAEDDCNPSFKLERLDNIEGTISSGFNYRLMRPYYTLNETSGEFDIENRDLIKLYGIRFSFVNSGSGGKFDIASLTVTLGAGLALLGVSTIVCDYIMVYFMGDRAVFKDEKYKEIDPEYLHKANPLSALSMTPQPENLPHIGLDRNGSAHFLPYEGPTPAATSVNERRHDSSTLERRHTVGVSPATPDPNSDRTPRSLEMECRSATERIPMPT